MSSVALIKKAPNAEALSGFIRCPHVLDVLEMFLPKA